MKRRDAGWYADPVAVGRARYWHEGWTDLIAWGGATLHDPTPLADIERAETSGEAEIVSDYLESAVEYGVISSATALQIRNDIDERVLGTPPPPRVMPPPPGKAPTPATELAGPTPSARHSVDLPPPGPVTPTPVRPQVPSPAAPIPVEPGRLAQWWHETRLVVRTDLAIHGLAYLGVLLLFAGVTGLIVFSFGDVAPWFRVLAEFLAPGTMFIAAWLLHRRGALVVAASLTILGGAILPVVVAATLTDGAPFPPDLSGPSLPIVQGLLVLMVAAAMVLVTGRYPTNPVRFLAAPIGWLAVGLAAGASRDPVPEGADVARPDALQLAVVLGAIAVTVAACVSRRSSSALARAALGAALPVAGVVYVFEFVLAGDVGWPLAGSIVTGLATVTLLELLADRLPGWTASVLQFLVVGITGARVGAHAPPEWVALGAAFALLLLVEHVGRRRPALESTIVGAAVTGIAFAVTLREPMAAGIAFGTLAVWAVWRHARPADWQPVEDRYGLVAAVAAAIANAALWDVAPTGPALIATAAAIALIAVAGRWRQAIADDLLWRWFVPASAVAVTCATTVLSWGDLSIEVAIAAAAAAGALALSALPTNVRVWLAATALLWSLANLGEAFDLSQNTQAVALALLAAALVVTALADPWRIGAHLATIGHVVGLAALTVPTWPGWAATAVVGAATAGWLVTAIVDERDEAVHLAALRDSGGLIKIPPEVAASTGAEAGRSMPVADLAPLLSFAGSCWTIILGVDAAGWVSTDDSWASAVTAGVAACAALVVRVVPWRRARRSVLSWATLATAVAAVVWAISSAGADRDHWSPVVALLLGLVTIGVAAPPRPSAFNWIGWMSTAALAGLLADRLGLDRDWTDVVIACWGAAALVGGLAVQRTRHGAVPPRSFVRDPLLIPPIVLGAAAFAGGGMSGLTDGTHTEIGWTATGLALVVAAAALLFPLGALVSLAEGLATVAYVLLAPWQPSDRPWTFAPWVLLLLIIAQLTRRGGTLVTTPAHSDEPDVQPATSWWAARWDLPSFVVAHYVAGIALIAAINADAVVETYVPFALLSISIAVVLHRWPWAAGGAMIALVAGIDAGGGWLAFVLAAEGVALSSVGVLRRRQGERWTLVGLGTACLVLAWFDFAVWQSWATATVYFATVPGGAAVSLAGALSLRSARMPRELAAAWSVAGALVSVQVAAEAIGDVDRMSGGLTLAGSLIALAVAAGLMATAFGKAMLWLAAGLAAIAWAPAAWAVEVSDTTATLVGTGVALATAAAVIYFHGRSPASAWLFPAAIYGTVTQAAAAVVSLSALPDRDLTIVVLLAASAELVAAGVLTGRPEVHVAAPVPACAAWLLFAENALAGEPNWFTVPIGLTMLIMVGLLRWIRRGRGGDPTAIEIVVLELVGMSFLVASGMVRILDGELWHGLLTLSVGTALTAWGGITRVRWRAAFGALTVVVTVVLLMGVPLSETVEWRGPALWLTLVGVGAAAIVVATFLEGNRARVRQIANRFDELTEGWERIPWHRGRPDDAESVPEPPPPGPPPPPTGAPTSTGPPPD